MIPRVYLNGVPVEPFEGLPGVFAAPHHKQPGAWRYISSYKDGKRHKGRIFELLRQYGQPEARRQWDLHHVVEGQHFADVDFAGELERVYEDELPVVLIEKNEHVAYNQLLHISETDEMFRDQLPKDTLDRSLAAQAAASTRSNHPELRARVQRLQQLYRQAYADDRILGRIAENVLGQALQKLR